MKTIFTVLLILTLSSCATTSQNTTPPVDEDIISAPLGARIFCNDHPESELCKTSVLKVFDD